MPINIKDPLTDAKIRELAELTGESITVAVRTAIEQRLQREAQRHRAGVAERLMTIGARLSARPRLLAGDADSALGYDEHGLPR